MKKINMIGLNNDDYPKEFFDQFENEEQLIRYFEDDHLKCIQKTIDENIKSEYFCEISRNIDKNKRYVVLNRQKWRCNTCFCKLKFSKYSNWDGEVAHIDHIHEYSKRDTYMNGAHNINELENLQALCPPCHDLKHGMNSKRKGNKKCMNQ